MAPLRLKGRFLIGTARTLKETVSGEVVSEKQSRFLACGAPIHSQVNSSKIIEKLIKQFRLKKASHLSWAIRLSDGTETKNDGGEAKSGNCILEVMRNMDTVNSIILVARWYGGKHLGGLRFKIYRNTTKELIIQNASTD